MAGRLNNMAQQDFGALIYSSIRETDIRIVQASNGKLINKLYFHQFETITGLHLYNKELSLFTGTEFSITTCWNLKTRTSEKLCDQYNVLLSDETSGLLQLILIFFTKSKQYSVCVKGDFYILANSQEKNSKIINLITKQSYELDFLLENIFIDEQRTRFAIITGQTIKFYEILPFKYTTEIAITLCMITIQFAILF